MVFNFTIIIVFMFGRFCKYSRILIFHTVPVISIACSLKDLQNFFIQSFPLYTSCLFSIPPNVHIVEIEYLSGTCSPTFFVGDLFKIIFTSIHSFSQRFKICRNNRWCLIRFLVLILLKYVSVVGRHYNTIKIFIFTYLFMRFKFVFGSKRIKTIQTMKIIYMFARYFS